MPEMTPKERADACVGEITRTAPRVLMSTVIREYIEQAVSAQREPMPCGHPKACLKSSSDKAGTVFCAACTDVADELERCCKAIRAACECCDGDGQHEWPDGETPSCTHCEWPIVAIRKVLTSGEPVIEEATTYSGYTDAFEHGVADERDRCAVVADGLAGIYGAEIAAAIRKGPE